MKIAPAWTTKSVKLTVKQTAEDALTATWTSIGTANVCPNVYQLNVSVGDKTDLVAGTYDAKTKTYSATVSGLNKGVEYEVKVTPIYNAGAIADIGTATTTTFTLNDLWTKEPVVKITSTDSMTVKGTVTYYGKPDYLYVYIKYPNDNFNDTYFYELDDAGADGKTTEEFEFPVYNLDNTTYLSGTYTVYAQAFGENTQADESGWVTSKTVKANVKEAFMENGAKVQSVVQTNEKQFTVTLKKALSKTTIDGRLLWVKVYYLDDNGEQQFVYKDLQPANTTVFYIDISHSQLFPQVDPSRLIFELQPLAACKKPFDSTETVGVTGKAMTCSLTKLSSKYWQAQPTLTVTQVGYNTIKIALSKSKASMYEWTVTDLDHGTLSGEIEQDGTVILPVDTLNLNSTLHVSVVPAVDVEGVDVTAFGAKADITLNRAWNSVSNVTLADGDSKKGNKVTVSFNIDGVADGVYVTLNDAYGNVCYGPAPVSFDDIEEATISTTKKGTVATVTINAPVTSGKYYAEVTPYLGTTVNTYDDEGTIIESELNVTTVGDSVISAKTAKITSIGVQ